MNELSLFTGIGGGVLGTKLLGWRTVGYVEINEYCQKIISQRIKDGIFDDAPIFGDIREFIDQGYAAAYQGLVDVITAGFPCQPFSLAGSKRGQHDDRNLWPETIEVVRQVEPRYVFLENVPGLLSFEYFGTILGDLSESGYDARWKTISAAEVGAPHRRDRVWIVAHSHFQPDTEAIETLLSERTWTRSSWNNADCLFGGKKSSVPGVLSESDVCREAHGVPYRIQRLKALGNAQVPAVVRTVWEILG